MELNEVIGVLELSPGNLQTLLRACKVTPETKNVIKTRLYTKDSGVQTPGMELDGDLVRRFEPLIRYYLGQMRVVHDKLRRMSMPMGSVHYKGKQWTHDRGILAILYYFAASTTYFNGFDADGWANIDTRSGTMGLCPTYSPSDPDFKMTELAEHALFRVQCFETRKDTIAAAQRGDAAAQFELAEKLLNWAPEEYRETAIDWYRVAAERGHVEAMFQYGFLSGDQAEQWKWYRRAAEKGNMLAQAELGNLYRNEAKDIAQAIAWYEKAAAQGSGGATTALVQIYSKGEGSVRKDPVLAVRWIIKMCEQDEGSMLASMSLMLLNQSYREGFQFVRDRKYTQGFQILSPIAEYAYRIRYKPLADALYLVGIMYGDGKGVRRDRTEAGKWLRRAADMGCADAREALTLL